MKYLQLRLTLTEIEDGVVLSEGSKLINLGSFSRSASSGKDMQIMEKLLSLSFPLLWMDLVREFNTSRQCSVITLVVQR